MKTLYTKVAGVTFNGRQEMIERLHGTELCRLEPEPENLYDPNAIAVKIAMPPEAGGDILHVGYIPKELAAEIAPHLEGENLICEINEITGGFVKGNGDTASYGLWLKVEIPNVI